MDHRPLDVGERVGGEVPPLDEEDAPARHFEVVVHRDGQRGDVAAVAVDRDEILEAVRRPLRLARKYGRNGKG